MVVDEQHYFSQRALIGKAKAAREQLEKESAEQIMRMEMLEIRRREKLEKKRNASCFNCRAKKDAEKLSTLLKNQHVYKGDALPERSRVVVTVPPQEGVIVSRNPVVGWMDHGEGSDDDDELAGAAVATAHIDEDEDWVEKANQAATTVQAAHRGRKARKKPGKKR